MDIHTNVPLKRYLTMQIGGATRFMTEVHSIADVQALLPNLRQRGLRFYVLGGGSNVIAPDEPYDGVVIRNRIMGVEQIAETNESVTFKVGAGEIWDDFVAHSVEKGLIGIEALSAIPGTCGAAPVQNIGAYGQEVSDTLRELEAFDTETNEVVTLSADNCKFSYRDSIFRSTAAGRYIILSITMQLYKGAPMPPFYKALQDYFDANNVQMYTPRIIREAVTAIRAEKLPDPAKKPNAGSFFKNAIIEKWLLDDLLQTYPDMPHYDMGGQLYKIPTGWLIEQCKLKGQLLHGMRVNPANALVLINESARGYSDLAQARDDIIQSVSDKFRIHIQQEPLEMR